MMQNQSNDTKAQPWEKHWPATTIQQRGDYHGLAAGEKLAVCGGGVGRMLTRLPRRISTELLDAWSAETVSVSKNDNLSS